MEGFKNMIPPKAIVYRDGNKREIEAELLVPGDIIEIPNGAKIPADIRILDSWDMRVDNSSLTGESDPLLRSAECTNSDNPLETKNLAFFGTFCKQGSGLGIVINTGDNSVIGQIANLASSSGGEKTPLRQELDQFIFMIASISIILGIIFFCLGFILNYPPITNLVFGIGIIVANVPEGLLGTLTLCLAITAKRLSTKQVLVKNLESVETLGSTTCICSDKTGTLTKNVMTVEKIWFDNKLVQGYNLQSAQQKNLTVNYNVNDLSFISFMKAAIINSDEFFNTSVPDEKLEELKNIHDENKKQARRNEITKLYNEELNKKLWVERPTTGGNASEAALIKFFQPVHDILELRKKYQPIIMADGNITKIPFNSMNKYSLIIVEEETNDSYYTLFTKGAPERVWGFCDKVLMNGIPVSKSSEFDIQFDEVNNTCGKAGERVLAFSMLRLPKQQFPKGFKFNMNDYNFHFHNQTFVGLISLIDPPRDAVPNSITVCKTAGIKVIMVTGDQPVTATAIARKVGIITSETANEKVERLGISFDEAVKQSDAVVIHGDLITRIMAEEEGLPETDKGKKLAEWVSKSQVVFARTSPAQKLIIVEACQKQGHIVAVTGDGVNDSPAIKQADIGIAMGIAGTEVAKDAADMILLSDDFSAIVLGVEEGRKIFDNLKKTCAYVLTSNIPEILPFISLIILRIPIPLSTVLILCIDLGTDVFPSMAYAYEESELDIMMRKPRKKHMHLVNAKMMTFAYLQMGWIESFGGFLSYFIVMEDFGFPFNSILNIVTEEGYQNKKGDVFDPNSSTLGNSNLNPNGSTNTSKQIMDWLFYNDINSDARMFYVRYNSKNSKWEQSRQFGECKLHKISPISKRNICYSTEALKYAQTAFFFSIVLAQYANAICCKTRKLSVVFQGLKNKVLFFGYFLEACITVFLGFVPGIQYGLGGRDVLWQHYSFPSIPFAIFAIFWEETRKYLIRNYPKDSSKPNKPNWFERNTLW